MSNSNIVSDIIRTYRSGEDELSLTSNIEELFEKKIESRISKGVDNVNQKLIALKDAEQSSVVENRTPFLKQNFIGFALSLVIAISALLTFQYITSLGLSLEPFRGLLYLVSLSIGGMFLYSLIGFLNDMWNRQKEIELCPPLVGIAQKPDSAMRHRFLSYLNMVSIIFIVAFSLFVMNKANRLTSTANKIQWDTKSLLSRGESALVKDKIIIVAQEDAEFIISETDQNNFNIELHNGKFFFQKNKFAKLTLRYRDTIIQSKGTSFLLNVSDDSLGIKLLEGQLSIEHKGRVLELDAKSANVIEITDGGVGGVLAQPKAFKLPKPPKNLEEAGRWILKKSNHIEETLMKGRSIQQPHRVVHKREQSLTKGDCVYFYKSGKRYEGKIYAENAGRYQVIVDEIVDARDYDLNEIIKMDCSNAN